MNAKTKQKKLVKLIRGQIRASKTERRRIERQVAFRKSELSKLKS